MPTPEEIKAQEAADAAAKAAAEAEAKAKDGASQALEVDLLDGVKVTLPKDQAVKVIAARDAIKAEARTLKETLTALQGQHGEATAKLKDLEGKLPEYLEAQKRAGDMAVKITELEKQSTAAKAQEEALAKILETKTAIVPEGMRSLIKGSTVLERLQNYEELFAAGVFKIPQMGPRKPGEGPLSEITMEAFNALQPAQRAALQADIRAGKVKVLIAGSA